MLFIKKGCYVDCVRQKAAILNTYYYVLCGCGIYYLLLMYRHIHIIVLKAKINNETNPPHKLYITKFLFSVKKHAIYCNLIIESLDEVFFKFERKAFLV